MNEFRALAPGRPAPEMETPRMADLRNVDFASNAQSAGFTAFKRAAR